ncbi:hypothetical protein IMSAGC006_02262 [Muribaculaceae bacterium]|nr:hypothetical protein IMSAGC006_02262 [Muribaculaceae bacterium]
MDEILHLHIEDQRLVGILDIESVEAAALGDDRYVGLVAEPLYGRLHADHVLRSVSLPRDKVGRAEIDILNRRREDDMDRLVVSHFQTVRGNHAVECQFPGKTVVEVSLGFLCESTHCAHHKGENQK